MRMLQHKFVEFIPDKMDDGILYISIEYCTAIHKCVCGCGEEVVTPISPTDWRLTFDGKTVSLYPSIGNWNFACKSHYWIKKSRIEFSGKWTKKEINDGRKNDLEQKAEFYKEIDTSTEIQVSEDKPQLTFWQRVSDFLRF